MSVKKEIGRRLRVGRREPLVQLDFDLSGAVFSSSLLALHR